MSFWRTCQCGSCCFCEGACSSVRLLLLQDSGLAPQGLLNGVDCSVCVCVCVFVCVCIFVCMYVYIYVCMYVCVFSHVRATAELCNCNKRTTFDLSKTREKTVECTGVEVVRSPSTELEFQNFPPACKSGENTVTNLIKWTA